MAQGGIISAFIPQTVAFTDDSNNLLFNVNCDQSVYVGAIVIMNSSGVAENALADSETNSNMIGICVLKHSSTLCDIRVGGVTNEIYTSLDVTKEYFLSDSISGGVQTTLPSSGGHVILKIGQPFSNKKMLVLKGQRIIRS